MLPIDVFIFCAFIVMISIYSRSGPALSLASYKSGNQISSFGLFTIVFGTLFTAVQLFNTSDNVQLFGFSYLIFACSDAIRALLICLLINKIFAYKHDISIGQTVGNFYGSWSKFITGCCGLFFGIAIITFQIKWVYITIDNLFDVTFNISFFIVAFLGIYYLYCFKNMTGNSRVTSLLMLVLCAIILYYLCEYNQKLTVFVITIILVFYSSLSGNAYLTFRSMLEFSLVVLILPIIFSEILNLGITFDNILQSLPSKMTNLKLELLEGENLKQSLVIFISTAIPICNPLVIQRIQLAQNPDQAKFTFLFASIAVFIFLHLVSLCSLVTSYLNQEIGQTNSFNAFLYLIQSIIGSPILKGLIFCGILSVMFSTMDAAINSANISLINDIIKNKILPDLDDKHDHKMIKISSLIICIICFVLCYFVKSLMSVVLFSINIWASTITIPLFARISNIKAPFYMFYVCGLCGVIINILYYSYDFIWLKSLGVVSSSIIIESILFMSMKFLISKFRSAEQKIYN